VHLSGLDRDRGRVDKMIGNLGLRRDIRVHLLEELLWVTLGSGLVGLVLVYAWSRLGVLVASAGAVHIRARLMVLALGEGLVRCGKLVVVGRLDVFEPVGVLIVRLRLILPRILGGLRAMRGLRAGEHVLHSCSDDFDHLLGLCKTLVLLEEALVDGGQV
jgi:hypothetical protein